MEGNTKRILYRLASQRERQTGDFMDWFTDGQTDWIHVLYGLAHKWNNPPSCDHFSHHGA